MLFDKISKYLANRDADKAFRKTLQTMLDAGVFKYTNEHDISFTDEFVEFCILHHPPQLELPENDVSGAMTSFITLHAVTFIRMNDRDVTEQDIDVIKTMVLGIIQASNVEAVAKPAVAQHDPMFS